MALFLAISRLPRLRPSFVDSATFASEPSLLHVRINNTSQMHKLTFCCLIYAAQKTKLAWLGRRRRRRRTTGLCYVLWSPSEPPPTSASSPAETEILCCAQINQRTEATNGAAQNRLPAWQTLHEMQTRRLSQQHNFFIIQDLAQDLGVSVSVRK